VVQIEFIFQQNHILLQKNSQMKKVAIIQSNYIPWKGYFDMINMVDVFVLYDDAQYTKRDWRNRNKIKTPQGLIWLTIPVEIKGKYKSSAIKEIKTLDNKWRTKHWKSIELNYKKAPYFNQYASIFQKLYLEENETYLSKINYSFIKTINKILGITTELKWSWEFELKGDKSEKLLNICKDLNADVYLSGPAAKTYLDVELFNKNGIEVQWMDYSGYPEYPQLYTPPFVHEVSIIDLIFNTGENAIEYMKSF